ncbi:MAG: hypothetical protein R3D68_20750 [Hyphomicrobiaceae bacterium]
MIVVPIEARAREWRLVRGEIRRMTAGRADLRAVEDIHRITIAAGAPDGLSAAITVDADGFGFQVEPLRIDVPTPVELLALVEKLVSGDLRLRIERAGGMPVSWTLETRTATRAWRAIEAMGVMNWRWWNARDVLIHRNGDAARHGQLRDTGLLATA